MTDEEMLAAQLAELGDEPTTAEPAALAALYDLALDVTIELGRTALTVQEILALGRGSVVPLDRLVGEPVDVFIGERRFAEGEVVVLGEQFGVRITRLVNGTSSAAPVVQ